MIGIKRFKELKDKIPQIKILVVGDCILDRYFFGEVNRISPEAPVPVFELRETTHSLGGSANVAANIRGLKARAYLMGVIGNDHAGEKLIEIAKENQIDTKGLLKDEKRPTILKTRVIALSQHLLRIDVEKREPLSKEMMDRFQEVYSELLKEVNGVIISDYAKGMFLSESFCSWLIREARKEGKPVFVDPKSASWKKYEGATTITPNLKEFYQTLDKENLTGLSVSEAARRLIEKFNLDFLVVTKGKEGIYAYSLKEGEISFSAKAREVYDVSGAGDTVIATLTLFYLAGANLSEALYIANLAGGIVVGKVGTKPVYLEEIEKEVRVWEE